MKADMDGRGYVEKYWFDSNKDLFKRKDYKIQLESKNVERWDEIVYLIMRGRLKDLQDEIIMDQEFHKDVILKDTGEGLLHVCAEANKLEIFKYFVQIYECNIMPKNYCGETPFHVAAREGNISFVRHYIDNYQKSRKDKFDVNHRNNDGWDAMMYATQNGNASIVEYLVTDARANLDSVDEFKRSCLHWACRFN